MIRHLVCGWCDAPFERRHSVGRPALYCSLACRYAHDLASRRATNHYIAGRRLVGPPCPPRIGCVVCNKEEAMACTNERHSIIKADRGLYEALTTPAGWQVVEGSHYQDVAEFRVVPDAVEMRLCVLCHSTLSDGTMQSGRRFDEVMRAQEAA